MSKNFFSIVRQNQIFFKTLTGFVVLFVSISWLLPMLAGIADAAQLTSRSLSINNGQPSATGVTYTYTFTPSAAAISSVKFVECTTAVATYGLASTSGVGTCVGPTGCTSGGGTNCLNQGTGGGFTGPNGWTNTTVPTRQTTTLNNCAPANNVLCITRTAGSAETAVSHTFTWNTQTNPSTANTTFYIGIYTYSDASFVTPVDSGTVASAVVQSLTINAAVAEVLNFCVGNTTVDNSTSDPTGASHDCTSVSGTSVNLGTLDSGHTNVTPVSTNCSVSDCGKNGVATVRSNAVNGTAVYYDAIAQGGTNHTRALRAGTATCDATDPSTSLTDQCFNSAGWNGTVASHINIVTGTENFGMTVSGVNCGSSASYTSCTGTASNNLVRATNYNGDGTSSYTAEADQSVTGTTTNKYAWDESATTPPQLATSSGSTTKVLDDESLILKFAATPSITTPFGAYTAKADFIAVSTY